jgi:hypothetical protein
MSTLRSKLDALAASFANQIIAHLQTSSLHDLIGSSDAGRAVGNGRAARSTNGKAAPAIPTAPVTKPSRKSGRLPRRSAEEIRATLDKIVLLVKTQKGGLRAEEIRSKLGMEAKEMPRILKEGVSTKKLTTKGQKRATTYFAK